jgi:capsular polysaccharide transport system permease protein
MAEISKQTPWQIQRSVVFAVFIRELKARFGRYSLGFIWALLEPIVFILMFSYIRGRFTGSNMAGIAPILFFASGVLTFSLFRNIITTSVAAVESNQGLFNYQRVKPADIVIARGLLEGLVILFTSALLFSGLYFTGYTFAWNSSLEVIGVLICLLMLAGGFGLIGCIIGPLWQDSKMIVPMLIRPFFYISGILFPANAIPDKFRAFALWNPVLHALELMREGIFANYSSHDGSWLYLFACSAFSLLLGLTVYRLFRVTVLTSGYIR